MTGYFKRIQELTPTKFWINNPTREEVDWAIREGAVGCTCNPAYCGKMLLDRPVEEQYVKGIIDELIPTIDTDTGVEEELQRRLVKYIADKFLPIYKEKPREQGYVSIQGDPIHEHDPKVIIREARKNRTVGENICCKIPTTPSGLEAMKTLIPEDIPINATECFAMKAVSAQNSISHTSPASMTSISVRWWRGTKLISPPIFCGRQDW